MSKMSDMTAAIEEICNAAAIKDTVDWRSSQFSGEPGASELVPAKESEMNLDNVRALLADMSCKGHTAEIHALIKKHGAAKLSGIGLLSYKPLLKDVEGPDYAE